MQEANNMHRCIDILKIQSKKKKHMHDKSEWVSALSIKDPKQ